MEGGGEGYYNEFTGGEMTGRTDIIREKVALQSRHSTLCIKPNHTRFSPHSFTPPPPTPSSLQGPAPSLLSLPAPQSSLLVVSSGRSAGL